MNVNGYKIENGADLQKANLSGANMTGAELTGATMPDGSLHE